MTQGIVYVQLLSEGTPVYRPVESDLLSLEIAVLGQASAADPTEEWEFQPGERVRIESTALSLGVVLVAVARQSDTHFDFLIDIAEINNDFHDFYGRLLRDVRFSNVKPLFDIRYPRSSSQWSDRQFSISFCVSAQTREQHSFDWWLDATRQGEIWLVENQLRRRRPSEEYDELEAGFPDEEVVTEELATTLKAAAQRLFGTLESLEV